MGSQTGMNYKILICLAMFMAFLAALGVAQTPP
jgi:hypothetical protein